MVSLSDREHVLSDMFPSWVRDSVKHSGQKATDPRQSCDHAQRDHRRGLSGRLRIVDQHAAGTVRYPVNRDTLLEGTIFGSQ
jgi:hypothetical protein